MAQKFVPYATFLTASTIVGSYMLEVETGGMRVCEALGFVPAHWNIGTALSSLFFHDPSNLYHVGGNVVFLLVFGAVVEEALGSVGFAALYLAAGLGGAALHYLVNPAATDPLVGCSGALFGLLAVAAVVRPRFLGFAVAFTGLNVWYAFMGGAGNVSFGCHIGGFFAGFLVVTYLWLTGSDVLEAA